MWTWRRFVVLVLKVALPIVTVTATVGIAKYLIDTKPQAKQQEYKDAGPAINAVRLERRTVSFPIRSQGTVQPRRETTLTARVAGQVEWLAECFYESGFFKQGDVLVRIDRRDYAIRIRRLEASLRSAKAKLLNAQQDFKRQQTLTESQATTEASVQQALATAEMAVAAVEELEAQLAEARNAESDTQIVAPFDGCIREKSVELGQFVTIGTKLASCFATDVVDVRLPVDDDDFAFLGLPLGVSLKPGSGPEVLLEAEFAGRLRRWKGNIVRSEAMVDSRSRMVYLVAQVSGPYSDTQANGGQPLAVGMFVEATIRCPPMAEAILLPESCVTTSGEIYFVDSEQRLQLARIKTLRHERDWIIAHGEVPDGIAVCATQLDHVVPGMVVQVQGTVEPVVAGNDAGGKVVDLTEPIELATRLQPAER